VPSSPAWVWPCSHHYRETTCPRRSDLISPAATCGATRAGRDVVASSGRRTRSSASTSRRRRRPPSSPITSRARSPRPCSPAHVLRPMFSGPCSPARFSGRRGVIDEISDWALPLAERAGVAGLVVACEPTGDRASVPPMLVARAREAEAATKNRADFDATLIARLASERRGHVRRGPLESSVRSWGSRQPALLPASAARQGLRDLWSATGRHSCRQPRDLSSWPRSSPSLGLDRSPGDRGDGRGDPSPAPFRGSAPVPVPGGAPEAGVRGRRCPGRGDERGGSRRRAGGRRPVGLAASPLASTTSRCA